MTQSSVIKAHRKILYLFQAVGLLYFSDSKCKELFYKIHFLISICLCICSIYLIFLTNTINKQSTSKIFYLAEIVHFSVGFGAGVLSVMQSFFKSETQKQILQNLDRIDELLEIQMGLKVSYKKHKIGSKTVFYNFLFNISYLLAVLIRLKPFTIVGFVPFVFGTILMKNFLLKFYFYVQLHKYRLQTITHILKHFDDPVALKDIKILLNIKKVYSMILYNSKLINQSFGISIGAIFLLFFMSITHKSYLLYLGIENGLNYELVFGNYCFKYLF